MRILFAGTPDAAVPSLHALHASEHEIAAVLTRADAKAGRGSKLTPSPVRVAAEQLGIPVITGNPSDPSVQAGIAALGCEAAAVVAYGHILRPAVLDLMPKGWFNLHFSLLPRWRGAAPVQWALISGDAETGVTVFQLDRGMDTGPIFATQAVELTENDNTETLLPRLAEIGACLLVQVFDDLAAGVAEGTPQAGVASLAPKITKEQAQINWAQPAGEIVNLVRGVTPNPGAWTVFETPDGSQIRLGISSVTLPDAAATSLLAIELNPGELRVEKKAVLVGTGTQPVRLGIVQPPGKKPMPATDWARGARLTDDSRFQ